MVVSWDMKTERPARTARLAARSARKTERTERETARLGTIGMGSEEAAQTGGEGGLWPAAGRRPRRVAGASRWSASAANDRGIVD